MVQTRQPSASSGTQAPAQAVSTWSGPAREQAVQRMFTAIAGVYDLNNTLLSFGLHYHWKKITASFVPRVEQGTALGVAAAIKPNTWSDYLPSSIAMVTGSARAGPRCPSSSRRRLPE